MSDNAVDYQINLGTNESSALAARRSIEQIVEALVDLDRASGTATEGIQDLSSSADDNRRSSSTLRTQLQQNIELLEEAEKATQKFDQRLKSLDKTARSSTGLDDLAARNERTARAMKEKVDTYGSVGDIGTRFSTATGALGGLGIQGSQNLMFATDIIDMTEALGTLGPKAREAAELLYKQGGATTKAAEAIVRNLIPGMSAAQVSATVMAGAITAAVGAFAAIVVALSQFQKVVKASGEATRAYLSYQQDYFELVQQGTSDSVRAALEERKARLELLQQRQAEIGSILDAADAVGGFYGAVIDLDDAVNANLGGSKDLEDEYNKLNAEAQGLSLEVSRLSGALEDGTFTARDLAAAENALVSSRLEQLQHQLSLSQEFSRATESEVQARIDLLTSQRDHAQAARDDAQALIDAANEMTDAGVTVRTVYQTQLDIIRDFEQDIADRRAAGQDTKGLEEMLAYARRQADALRETVASAEAAEQILVTLDGTIISTSSDIEYLTSKELELARARDEAAQKVTALVDAADAETTRLERLASMTEEQARDELEALQRREDAIKSVLPSLEELASTSPEAAAQLKLFNDELTSLAGQKDALTALLPSIQAHDLALRQEAEAEAEAERQLAELEARQQDWVSTVRDAVTAQREFTEESVELERSRQAEILDLELNLARKQAELLKKSIDEDLKAQRELLDAQKEVNRSLIEALEDSADELSRSERDTLIAAQNDRESLFENHQRRLIDIQQRAQDAVEDSALTRDAESAFRALRQAGREQRDEKTTYSRAQSDLEKSLDQRLAELRRANQDERQEQLKANRRSLEDLREKFTIDERERRLAYADETRALHDQLAQDLRDKKTAWDREDVERLSSHQKRLGEFQGHLRSLETSARTSQQTIETLTRAGHLRVASDTQVFYQQLAQVHNLGMATILSITSNQFQQQINAIKQFIQAGLGALGNLVGGVFGSGSGYSSQGSVAAAGTVSSLTQSTLNRSSRSTVSLALSGPLMSVNSGDSIGNVPGVARDLAALVEDQLVRALETYNASLGVR